MGEMLCENNQKNMMGGMLCENNELHLYEFMKWQRGSYLRLSAWSRERIFGVKFLCKRDIKGDIFLAEFWHKFF